MSGQERPGHELSGQDGPGHASSGQDRPGHGLSGQDRPGHEVSGQDRPGQNWLGLVSRVRPGRIPYINLHSMIPVFVSALEKTEIVLKENTVV